MTNEYEQAVNLIKAFLIDFDCETGDTDYIEPDDLQALYEQGARRLLDLTYPSGQRVLAVLAENQNIEMEHEYCDCQTEQAAFMYAQGFRRTVEEKR